MNRYDRGVLQGAVSYLMFLLIEDVPDTELNRSVYGMQDICFNALVKADIILINKEKLKAVNETLLWEAYEAGEDIDA